MTTLNPRNFDSSELKFNFDPFLKKEHRFGLDPNRPICRYYEKGHCPNGKACPDKHIHPTYSNKIVCKHWLRGLCKKGDACEFLHEYNLRKMPECQFFSRNGFCTQLPDCLYLHIDPQTKIPLCPNYERGFCKLGPECPKRHVRKEMCLRFLTGFCPLGNDCDRAHPKFVGITDSMRITLDDHLRARLKDREENSQMVTAVDMDEASLPEEAVVESIEAEDKDAIDMEEKEQVLSNTQIDSAIAGTALAL